MKVRAGFYFLILFTLIECLSCRTGRRSSSVSTSNGKKQYRPLALTPLGKALPEVKIFSKNVNVEKLEAFDIDEEGNIYYATLGDLNEKVPGKNAAHEVFIYKAKPDQQPNQHMTLKYFGHPYNISIEEEGGETYFWVSSNGSKDETGKYWNERSVSRIKYEAGRVYERGFGGETFFLNKDNLKTQVSINKEGDLICIAAEKNKDWSFYTYKLSDVKALPDTFFTFQVTFGGEEIGSEERTLKRTVRGHDLNRLKPVSSFTVPGQRNNKPTGLNSFWLQGFAIDANSYIYFLEGEGNREGRAAQAYVTVLDVQGRIVEKRTKVEAIASNKDLNEAGIINNLGNMEPEGMTVKDNSIYLGFLSHGLNNTDRKANIFRYESRRK